jgi:hypothetical protein
VELISLQIKSHVHVKDNNRVEKKEVGRPQVLENPWQTNSLALAYD